MQGVWESEMLYVSVLQLPQEEKEAAALKTKDLPYGKENEHLQHSIADPKPPNLHEAQKVPTI